MTKLILIRNPSTSLGETDSPAAEFNRTEVRRQQALKIGEGLINNLRGQFTVWSSVAEHGLETARTLAERLGGSSVADARLTGRQVADSSEKVNARADAAFYAPSDLKKSTSAASANESSFASRLRADAWLVEILQVAKSSDIHVVVGDEDVIEHLHFSLSSIPLEAMALAVTFCSPGHAHIWRVVDLPGNQRIRCCIGVNVSLVEEASLGIAARGFEELEGVHANWREHFQFRKSGGNFTRFSLQPDGDFL